MKKYVLATLVLIMSTAAFADDSAFQTCVNKNDSDSNWQQCAGIELKRADAQLNVLFKQLKAEVVTQDAQSPLGPNHNGVKALMANENAWITFRDSTCNLVIAGLQGGSGTGDAATQCQIDETNVRAQKLQSLIQDWAPSGR